MIAVGWWKQAIRFRVQDERERDERRETRDRRRETRDLIIMASQAREIKEIHFGALKIIVDGGSCVRALARPDSLAHSLTRSLALRPCSVARVCVPESVRPVCIELRPPSARAP